MKKISNNIIFPPGAKVLIRDEEWLVKGSKSITTGGVALSVVGLSEFVKDHHSIFLSTLDTIQELKPQETKLVSDDSPTLPTKSLALTPSHLSIFLI